MSCPSNSPYTFNIMVDNNKLSYRIFPDENTDGDQKNLMLSKLNELRWVNPLDNTESNQFINNSLEESTQCFTGDTTKVINNCYITRTCDSGNKIIDYECSQTIPYNLNEFALETDNPLPISNFTEIPNIMPQSSPDFRGNFGYVRCNQGFVFKQLQHNMDTEKEYATAKWVRDRDKIWWVRPDTRNIPTPTNHELSGECVPDKCEDKTIPDSSSHSYDPLVGGYLQDPITIHCNDGYIFNHDLLHQGGKVKCDYDLIKEGENIWSPNKMSWYIHDDRLESMCNKYTSEEECIGGSGYPIPTYNPYKFLNIPSESIENLYHLEMEAIHDINGVPIGCQWSPPTTQQNDSSTMSKEGECKFRKKVDSETQEKICNPLYCPQKTIPNSNRDNRGTNHPLPGPRHALEKEGDCIADDGTIIDVDNVQDCLCQKHMSCNSCTTDNNCQWCGSDTSEPGCYYKNTNEPICNDNPVRLNTGGSCRNILPGEGGGEKPGWSDLSQEQKNISSCEDEFECRNRQTNAPIPSLMTVGGTSDKSIESIRNYFQINTGIPPPQDRELCLSYNNRWSTAPGSSGNSNDDICYISKKYVNNQQQYRTAGEEPKDFPLYHVNPSYKLSINPYFCKPKNLNDTNAINNCPKHSNYETCAGDNKCSWEENPFSNDIINWSAHREKMKYRDLIKIKQNTDTSIPTCYMCDNKITGTKGDDSSCKAINDASPTKQFVVASIDGSDNYNRYVTLKDINDNPLTIDQSVQGKCIIQYSNESTFSKNNLYNISNVLTDKIHGNYRTENDALNCKDGFKFCSPSAQDTSCDNGVDFISSSSILTDKGSDYCPMSDGCKSKRCFESIDNPRGSILITDQISENFKDIYNKDNFYSLSGKLTQGGNRELKRDVCNTTFNYNGNISTGVGEYNDIKYSKCNLFNEPHSNELLNKQSCDILNKKINGKDTNHWGKFCKKRNGSDMVPMKHVCEKAGNMYEWKEKWSEIDKIWIGRCYNVSTPTMPTPISDSDLCSNIATPSDQYEPETSNKCIITVQSNKRNEIIDGICEKWETDITDVVSDNIFEYHEKSDSIFTAHSSNRFGHCIVGRGRNLGLSENLNRATNIACEYDNNEYLQKYKYDDSSHCDANNLNYKVDRNLRWTGGELRNDGGEWVSECSAGILSSCQVQCNNLYGGGGTYTCHYNNHSEDVCQHVEDTFSSIPDENIQKTNCIHHPNCQYEKNESDIKNSTCKLLVDDENLIKGQAEWLGNSCYLLNNDAFSHGIYNLSTIDEYFPPLIRLIVFFLIIILFALLFRKAKVYSILINILIGFTRYIGIKITTGTAKFTTDTIKGSYNFITNIRLIDYTTLFKSLYKLIKNIKWIIYIIIVIIILIVADKLLNYGVSSKVLSWIKDKFTYTEDYIKKIKEEKEENEYGKYINLYLIISFVVIIALIQYFLRNKNNNNNKLKRIKEIIS